MGSGDSMRQIAALIGICLVLKVPALPMSHNPTSYYNVDSGELRDDIPDINRGLKHLFEGDIAGNPSRNAILDETKRWQFPIPYILTDSLDLNAKGVILQAFEEYRLRSCVDFKPYEGETTYISFIKGNGCWSYVGDFKVGQNLSIGAGCDTKAIVEHELLHALGFYHEQSRSDRDDYVNIHWNQIEEGKEHNFNKYEDDFITDLNTPYDYESVMHYRPLSFNINPDIPTITTVIPYFNDIIGQRQDFSASDITRLNRMYDCANTITLLDQCSFEETNICGMIQNEDDDTEWVQTLSSPSDTDHTLTGRCRDSGYYMKFSAPAGQSALLESRILYPKRNEQCLQFFYKMSGTAGDKLVIWTRSYDGTVDSIRKIHTITGGSEDPSWKIAHVPLKMTEKFRYVFQGISNSSGAILIDDISLTETVCPETVYQIPNFTNYLNDTPGSYIFSPCFQNAEGYYYGFTIFPNGYKELYQGYVSIFMHLCFGENDAVLEWPVANRQLTAVVMDQDPDVKLRMSSTRSFTTDNDTMWDKPITWVTTGYGWSAFISHSQLKKRSFLKNNDFILTADFSDLTHLIKTEVPVKAAATRNDIKDEKPISEVDLRQETPKKRNARATDPCSPNPCFNGGVCVEREGEASCRCASSQTTFYTGQRCEEKNMNRSILGGLIGGAAGTVVLTLAIFTVIRRA